MTERYLKIYLRDHFALGQAGMDLCHRIMKANSDNPLGPKLEEVLDDLGEEVEALRRVMNLLDVTPSPLKVATYRLAEKAGRLKLNGELTRYSPVSRMLEIEGLMSGVIGRRELWATLEDARRLYPALEEIPIDIFKEQADAHLEILQELHQRATALMLKGGEHQGGGPGRRTT